MASIIRYKSLGGKTSNRERLVLTGKPNMRTDNETRNVKPENHFKGTQGFRVFLKTICDKLVEKGLLDLKQAVRFMERSDEDLVKFKKLVHMFMDRGTKSLEFLFVLRKIDNYPEFTRRVQKIIDDFEGSLKSSVSGPSRMKLNGFATNKRSNDFDQSDENQSTKRSKSEMYMNSCGIRRDVSRRTEEKDLNRLSCPASICWEDHAFLNTQEEKDKMPLQEKGNHDGNKSKLSHISIGMPPICDQMATKPLLSESKENLSDIDKVLEEVSSCGKIKKKKKKPFSKKLKAFGVIVMGAVATVAFIGQRTTDLASRSALAGFTKNASFMGEIGPAETVDNAINTVESKVYNSSMYSYQFNW